MFGAALGQSADERFGRMIRDEVLKVSNLDGHATFGHVSVHELFALARGLGISDNKFALAIQWLEDMGCAEIRDDTFYILCHPLD
jgi:hypothetical protein